jgi:hypothetical protein
VGQRTSFNRTGVAGNLDEIQGVLASTLKLLRNGASLLANSFGVGFIDWLRWFCVAAEVVLRVRRAKRCHTDHASKSTAAGAYAGRRCLSHQRSTTRTFFPRTGLCAYA